jgi:hypothetical protein
MPWKTIKPANTKSVGAGTWKTIKPPQVKPQMQVQPQPKPGKLGGAFNFTMNQLVKPVSSASNLLEDTGKVGGYYLSKILGSKATPEQARQKLGIDFLGHQKDVWTGNNQRTYSDITREIENQQSNPILKNAIKTVGYGGDFMLDPLNKVKIAALTAKGLAAAKVGKGALSMAEQANKGERALLQLGKFNILPSVGNKVLAGTTKLNDLIRGTRAGAKVMDIGAAISGKIRPGGVSREEFKILTDAKNAARNTTGYLNDKAVNFAKGIAKTLSDKKATQSERAILLHAIEKGDVSQVPKGLEDVFKQGVDFKTANEKLWTELGGSKLEGYGLAHVATKEVAEQARKDAFKGQGGFKLTSTQTPQDIHRQYMKVDGKIVKLSDEGIIYNKEKGFLKPTQPQGITPLQEGGIKVYHGTGSNFDAFNDSMRGSITGAKSAKGAIWFTEDPATAKAYSIYASEDGPIKALQSQMDEAEKIAQRSGLQSDWKKYDKLVVKQEDLASYDKTFARRNNAVVKQATIKNGDFLTVDAKGKSPQELSAEGDIDSWLNSQLDKARAKGKDGVKFVNLNDAVGLSDRPATHYAIFDSKNASIENTLKHTDITGEGKILSQPQGITPLQEGGKRRFVPAKVEQASAMEINNALVKQGKKAIFQEDLPIVAAKMGISTGRKQAATEFLEATKGLKSEEAIKLASEVHNKMTNPESLRKAIQGFDAIQNVWKAQALVAPSYHIRNIAGNLWNNYLADVKTPAYALAGKLQASMKLGKLSKAEAKVVKEMETHGVIGTGQYLGDIEQTLKSKIGVSSINPFSQNFIGYKANRALGGGIEDNAKIAHYLSKRAEGYGVKEAAESVKKYLFDYGDLTNVEKGLLKRVMPFYTWTSKNIPLQVQQFVENPGKFSKIATAKKDIEQGVAQPNEKYMSDYISGNAPIRVKTDKDGNTMYFLAGAWLPAAQALTLLSNPKQNLLGMVSPALKLPYENLSGKGTFFQNTLGQYEDIQKFPGQKTSYLGMDLNPQTVNNLRSIRPLNELNNLNPFGIFGTKNSPSILKGILPNASNVRGGQNTPETSQQDRVMNAFIGKLQGYNPDQSKTFYDRDTQNKVTEFNTAINRALSNDQTDLASKIIKQMEQFVQSRNGQPNEALKMYNLMGDQYFKDQAQNKQAEKSREQIRTTMKAQIRQGLESGDTNMVNEALKLDPSYAKQAIQDALKEKAQGQYTPEQQKQLYEMEQAKKKLNLTPFYKN